MREIFLSVCGLAALVVTSCRPAGMPAPLPPVPAIDTRSPLPAPIVPQSVPAATREGSPSPVSTPIAASGIHLTATLGSTCPGPARPNQVCTQPYEGLFAVTNANGAEVARFTTDQNGKATIDLPPGDYTITPKVEGRLPSGAPVTATVLAGQYAEVSLELDSGMR
jgi:hypothetical protein